MFECKFILLIYEEKNVGGIIEYWVDLLLKFNIIDLVKIKRISLYICGIFKWLFVWS